MMKPELKLSILIILTHLKIIISQLRPDPENNRHFTYDFNIINENENPSIIANYSIFDNILINKHVPILRNVFFKNDYGTYDLLMSTNSGFSIMANKNCSDCNWALKKYQTLSMAKNKYELTQQFSFGKVSGYLDKDKVNLINYSEDLELNFISVTDTFFMNTQFIFSGIIGLGLCKTNFLTKIFEGLKINRTVGIEYNLYNNFTDGKLHLGDFPTQMKNNLTYCSQLEDNPSWGCKMDYLMMGDEYDFYLAKYINAYVFFDSLSYFHLVPYEVLEYFQSSYFSANNNCRVNAINANSTLFRIECFDFVGLLKIKSLNIILNGWAYRLGSRSLFDDFDIINPSNSKNNTYYFKVLFSKDTTVLTIGNGFFRKFMLGFNYDTNKVLFYSYNSTYDIHNFTKYTSENMKDDSVVFYFILVFSGLILLFMITVMWVVFYYKNRKILKNYEAQFMKNQLNEKI